MRAKRVIESVHFERGKNPKKSMSIGKHSLRKEFTEYYDDMLDYFVENLHILIGEKYKRGLQNSSLTMEEFERVKDIIKEYLGECTWDEYLLDTNVTFNDLVSRLRSSVTESVNFERGKDPISSMGIGHYSKYANEYGDEIAQIMPRMKPLLDKYGFYLEVEDLTAPIKLVFNNGKGDRIEIFQLESLFGVYGVQVEISTKDSGFFFDEDSQFHGLEEIENIFKKNIFQKHFGKTLKENINFERGKDPKTAMDIGRAKYAFPVEDIYSMGMRLMPPEKADKYLRTVLPRRLKSVISRPGAVWNWPRFQDGLHYADAKWIMRQGYSGIKYRGTFYPFPEIEGYNFQREDGEWIDESLNFERGKDPKKVLRLGGIRPYPDMTVDQFQKWFTKEIVPYLGDYGEQALVDNLLINDWEADWEVAEYLRGRNLSPEIVDDLMYMRGYFNDREYIKGLFDEDYF